MTVGSVRIVKNAGMTLIELIAILLCVSILLLITAATWQHYAKKIRQNMAVYNIRDGLMYARTQAIAHHRSMLYCGSSDLVHCDGDWEYAQLVKDKRSNTVLKTYKSNTKSVQITFRASFGAIKTVEFTPQGMTHGQQGHFSVCLTPAVSAIKRCKWLVLHFSGEAVVLNPAA